MKEKYSVAQAKNHLPRLIHAAEDGHPIAITRRGETVAVLLSIQEFNQLSQGSKTFGQAMRDFCQQLQKEQAGLTQEDFPPLRDRSPGRELPW